MKMYMHILDKPDQAGFIFIPELKQKIVKAVLYNGKKEVKFRQQPEGTFIYMDGVFLNDVDTVVELTLL